MPPLAEEEASIDSPREKLALDVDNSHIARKETDLKKLNTDLKDPRFRRKMMEIRSLKEKHNSGEYGSQRRK